MCSRGLMVTFLAHISYGILVMAPSDVLAGAHGNVLGAKVGPAHVPMLDPSCHSPQMPIFF